MNMLLHNQSKPHKCFITTQTILGRAKNGRALYYFAIQDVGKMCNKPNLSSLKLFNKLRKLDIPHKN